MLPSYEAIYDHGRLTWIGEAPGPLRARVIVTPIPELSIGESPATDPEVPNGNRLAAILTKMAETDIGQVFGDPLEWQKEVRKDRPLPAILSEMAENGTGKTDGDPLDDPREILKKNLPRKHFSEDEIERIMNKTRGAWGTTKTLKEVEAMIKQRRLEDWGED